MSSNNKRPSALDRIRSIFSEPVHPYRPATEIFLDLNVDRIADEMRLAERGKERGAQNRPASDTQTLDDIEHQIMERVTAHKQDSHTIYLDHLHTYDDRITALSFEEALQLFSRRRPKRLVTFEPKRP